MSELSSSSLLVPELSTIGRVHTDHRVYSFTDIELLDTLQGELISLDQNPNRLMNLRVISRASRGSVAENTST
jgi:hypothetical protein